MRLQKNVVDEEVVRELALHFGQSYARMEALVKEVTFLVQSVFVRNV